MPALGAGSRSAQAAEVVDARGAGASLGSLDRPLDPRPAPPRGNEDRSEHRQAQHEDARKGPKAWEQSARQPRDKRRGPKAHDQEQRHRHDRHLVPPDEGRKRCRGRVHVGGHGVMLPHRRAARGEGRGRPEFYCVDRGGEVDAKAGSPQRRGERKEGARRGVIVPCEPLRASGCGVRRSPSRLESPEHRALVSVRRVPGLEGRIPASVRRSPVSVRRPLVNVRRALGSVHRVRSSPGHLESPERRMCSCTDRLERSVRRRRARPHNPGARRTLRFHRETGPPTSAHQDGRQEDGEMGRRGGHRASGCGVDRVTAAMRPLVCAGRRICHTASGSTRCRSFDSRRTVEGIWTPRVGHHDLPVALVVPLRGVHERTILRGPPLAPRPHVAPYHRRRVAG